MSKIDTDLEKRSPTSKLLEVFSSVFFSDKLTQVFKALISFIVFFQSIAFQDLCYARKKLRFMSSVFILWHNNNKPKRLCRWFFISWFRLWFVCLVPSSYLSLFLNAAFIFSESNTSSSDAISSSYKEVESSTTAPRIATVASEELNSFYKVK